MASSRIVLVGWRAYLAPAGEAAPVVGMDLGDPGGNWTELGDPDVQADGTSELNLDFPASPFFSAGSLYPTDLLSGRGNPMLTVRTSALYSGEILAGVVPGAAAADATAAAAAVFGLSNVVIDGPQGKRTVFAALLRSPSVSAEGEGFGSQVYLPRVAVSAPLVFRPGNGAENAAVEVKFGILAKTDGSGKLGVQWATQTAGITG